MLSSDEWRIGSGQRSEQATEVDRGRVRRGQVTMGTLAVFLAMVLVAAIAAGVLLNTAGFLEAKAQRTAHQSSNQVTDRVQVLHAVGLVTPADGPNRIGGVLLVVTKPPGATDVDVQRLTIQWIDDTGSYDLVHEGAATTGSVDGEFTHTVIKDDDQSLAGPSASIDDRGDRVAIVVDVGNPETSGKIATPYRTTDAATVIRSRPGGLREGTAATLRIATAAGATSSVRIVVPNSIDGQSAIRL